ncbi:putative disease resistance protein [Vitis vinifera]|uniref:Putative disease resistance protein n=1 Tax=Vitis vinifera TaxID=29760 RepID=A0A438CAA5_VITVI|nr:putative disease resistance protein [Vitis vinifera]
MAEGTVTFFAEKLSNLILQEASVFGQVEGQIKLLRNELEWMRLFLKDADSKRIHDERIKLWVNQIRNATHDAEDVIDEFIVNMDHRQRRLNTLKLLKCLPTCVGFADKLPFIHELDSRVKDINVMIGAIMANRSKYGLGDLVASSSSTTDQVAAHKEKRPPVVEESDVVGIEDGTEEVKQMLMKEETRRSVVSIVGMGGLGKTTLAKKVYNQRMSNNTLIVKLGEKEKEMRESELGEKLCEYLKEKKYLVVMDDVWSSEVWSRLRSHLPEAKDGSKVLITTRNKEIALHATSQAFIYELRLMNDDESWQLFLKKTFQGTSTPHTLIRRGLLSTKEKTKPSWEKVLASIEWYLDQGPESCMGILALSYNDLPYYLKSCFLYCGIFPEDSEIKASKLIRLWLAEGFIQRRGKETLEDIAEDYMHELIHRSLIQVAERRVDGGVESCRMHDLLRDLAVLEAKDAKFFELGKTNMLPRDIGEFIHLKFLCINGHGRVTLPSSICRLVNLQSLNLGDHYGRGSWLEGDGLGKLTQLRKLVLGGLLTPYLKKGFFESITKLTALQTLALGIEKEVEKLPEQFEFYPPNLLKLGLWDCELRDDPMMILEKLPSLRKLELGSDAYVGKKMICSSGGFLQLESLILIGLNKLEELTVEEGAMSSLKTLEIWSCGKMKKLPHGLLQLTNLEKLSLRGSSYTNQLKRLKRPGEKTGISSVRSCANAYFKLKRSLDMSIAIFLKGWGTTSAVSKKKAFLGFMYWNLPPTFSQVPRDEGHVSWMLVLKYVCF